MENSNLLLLFGFGLFQIGFISVSFINFYPVSYLVFLLYSDCFNQKSSTKTHLKFKILWVPILYILYLRYFY